MTPTEVARVAEPLTPLAGLRIAATPAALDRARWPGDALVLRLAPDEALVLTAASSLDAGALDDAHAIVVRDRGWHGLWLPAADALELLERHADWAPPAERPAVTQGLVAGIPAKVWLGVERALIAVAAPVAGTFAARVR